MSISDKILPIHTLVFLALCISWFSCTEAEYSLDNPFDPENLNLDSPALFFHKPSISTTLWSDVDVEIYGLNIDSTAAAYIELEFDWDRLRMNHITPGPFFDGENSPIILVDSLMPSKPKIYIYYLPDMESEQSEGGTLQLAKISFTTINDVGGCSLKFGSNTELRDKNNQQIILNDFGLGYIYAVE